MATKKFMVLLIFSIMLVSTVSAFEFDNLREYDRITREVTIKNSFLGIPTTTVATSRLVTPIKVVVPTGYQKVGEFEIKLKEDYTDIIKNITFYDLNNDKAIVRRNYDLKYKSIEYVLEDLVKEECTELRDVNKTEVCEYVKVGSKRVRKEVWLPLSRGMYEEGRGLTIGIFTEVQEGDFIDWVPKMFGVEVPEWASFGSAVLYEYYYDVASNFDSTNGGHALQQGFTVGTVGANEPINVVGVSLNLTKVGSPTGKYQVFIEGAASDIAPNGTIYYGGSFLGSEISTGSYAFYNISLTDIGGVPLAASTQYSIVLYRAGDDDASNYLRWALDNVGSYAGGDAGRSASNGTMAWGPVGAGGYYHSFQVWGNNQTDESPVIIFNSPNSTNYTTSPQTIQFNFTAYDGVNLSDVKLFINSTLNQTNASGINDSVYLFNVTFNDGTYTVFGRATDNESQSTDTGGRVFVIDSTAPVITIESPNTTYDTLVDGQILDLNYSIEDQYPATCWYIYNSTTTYLPNCSTNTSFTYITGQNNLTFFANDTLGNLNSVNHAWTTAIIFNSFTFPNLTISGSSETFSTNVTVGSSPLQGVNLVYDGTDYAASVTSTTGNSTLTYEIIIPGVNVTQNVTFYWEITLANANVVNSANFNITVQALNVDDCTNYTTLLANLTLVDEELQTDLSGNTTIEVALDILSEGRDVSVVQFSNSYNNTNPAQICIDINLTETFKLDAIIRYTADGYAIEYYNIFNFTLNNNSVPQIITLYVLDSDDSTDFQLTFKGSDFLPVENALVYVDRQYIPEDTFKTVEIPKTDSNGQTVLHLVRNDVIYNLRILLNGTVLGTFQNIIAFCEDFTIGDCQINLNAESSTAAIYDYDTENGITYTQPVYNSTAGTISFSYTSVDGSAKTVLMNVSRNDIFGNTTICNDTLISASGTLVCTIPGNLDDSTLKVNIYVNTNLIVITSVRIDQDNYGDAGYLVFFVMVLGFVLMFMDSKSEVLVGLFLAFIGGVGLGIISNSVIGVGASGIWIAVIIGLGLWRLNKERPQ